MADIDHNYSPVVQADLAPWVNNVMISWDFYVEGASNCYVLIRQPDLSKLIEGFEGFGAMFYANKLGSEDGPVVADTIEVTYWGNITGIKLTDLSIDFLSIIKEGYVLHLQKSDNSWVTAIISKVELNSVSVDISSADYNNNYYITADTSSRNVFIVDTNLRAENARTEPMLLVDGTLSYFLTAGHIDIEASIVGETPVIYHAEMIINAYNAVGIKIWKDGDSVPTDYQVKLGGLDNEYQQYYPLSDPSDTCFGIYVDQTKAYEYYFGNIQIAPLGVSWVMTFLQLKATDLVNDAQFVLYGYGAGATGTPGSEVLMQDTSIYFWNVVDDIWDKIDLASPGDPVQIFDIEMGLYKDTDGYVNCLICPTYPSSPTSGTGEPIESSLNIDFVKLEQETTAGYHIGNMGDVYIKPDSLIETFTTVTVSSSPPYDVPLIADNGFKLHPMIISSVQLLDIDGNPVQDLMEGMDYVFVVINPTVNYSCHEFNALRFNAEYVDSDVRINYQYFGNLNDVQDLLDSTTDGQSATSKGILTYTFHPVFLNMTIACTIDTTILTEDHLKDLIISWVKGLTSSYSDFEFLSFLDDIPGLTNVDTQNFNIDILKRDIYGVLTTIENVENYTIDTIERFMVYKDIINISVIA